jgi:23S rRNA (uracil1939-C5)-methyltransferase
MAGMQQKVVRGPVTLEEIHSSGRSIAVYENKKVYLDFGMPGETVTFALERRKQGFRAGQVIELHSPSAHRADPFCIHSRQCGGCPWQHIDYPYQLELKHMILCNALAKYGIDTPAVPPVIPSPDIHYYRNRLEYSFALSSPKEKQTPEKGSGSVLGFHRYGEPGKITDIRECFLQSEPSRAICEFVKSYALEQGFSFYDHEHKTGFLRSLSIRIARPGQTMVVIGFAHDQSVEREKLLNRLLQEFPSIVSLCWTIHLSHAHSQLQGEIIPFGGTKPYLHMMLAGNMFRVHAASFFQPNLRQSEQILLTARDWADLQGSEKIFDLYTGVGAIALTLASQAGHVTGIEGSPLAVEDARENAEFNRIGNAEFLAGDILKTFNSHFMQEHGRPDLIVLDPPRPGTLIEIKKAINASGAGKVIYLSCNPVSLAFDLKQLTEVYKVTRIQPFDMLPHTHHLETLVMLGPKQP